MSNPPMVASVGLEKREDFLIESLKHMESRLQGIRCEIMRRAAELARSEAPANDEVFEVRISHVNRALVELFNNPAECKKAARLT